MITILSNIHPIDLKSLYLTLYISHIIGVSPYHKLLFDVLYVKKSQEKGKCFFSSIKCHKSYTQSLFPLFFPAGFPSALLP